MTDDTSRVPRYEPIALSDESTVVAEFIPEGVRQTAYQSEDDLEKALIRQLQTQACEYLPITTEADLVLNLRRQLETLNKLTFSDAEWRHFLGSCIASANDGIIEKTARIQEDHIQVLKRADGKNKPITELMDFTKTFFARHTLLNILTRYCVFDVDRKLLVMRP